MLRNGKINVRGEGVANPRNQTTSAALKPEHDTISDGVDEHPADSPEPKRAKRSTEKNPTYRDAAHLESDLEAFLGRLHFVIRIIAMMFGLHKPDQEDLAQTVFLKAWERPNRVPSKRGQWSWLLKVAYRTAIDTYRKERRYVYADLDAAVDVDDEDRDSPTDVSIVRAVYRACESATEKLPAVVDVNLALSELVFERLHHEALFLLNVVEEYSVRDIEAMTGIGRTQVSLIIRSIKREYRERYPDYAACVP